MSCLRVSYERVCCARESCVGVILTFTFAITLSISILYENFSLLSVILPLPHTFPSFPFIPRPFSLHLSPFLSSFHPSFLHSSLLPSFLPLSSSPFSPYFHTSSFHPPSLLLSTFLHSPFLPYSFLLQLFFLFSSGFNEHILIIKRCLLWTRDYVLTLC